MMILDPRPMKLVPTISVLTLLLGFPQLQAAPKAPRSLEVKVCARARVVETGLCVRAGETLRFSTPAGAKWWDIWFKRAADGSGKGSFYPWYMNRVRCRLAVPKSPAFALHGRVGSGKAFLIGLGGDFAMVDAGPLVLFTNDVPGFYWQNFGAIAVTIAKVKTKKK